jgi:hypothetical protein
MKKIMFSILLVVFFFIFPLKINHEFYELSEFFNRLEASYQKPLGRTPSAYEK